MKEGANASSQKGEPGRELMAEERFTEGEERKEEVTAASVEPIGEETKEEVTSASVEDDSDPNPSDEIELLRLANEGLTHKLSEQQALVAKLERELSVARGETQAK